ncbi:MAG TPA: TRAP transporter small permease, partial [Gammaproteobacteria bacterium]|nr:TRAP transporter small permease [Gammaproteobacteria bacterium]
MFARLIQWMNGAGVIGIFALTFLICADITGRTVFARPISGVTEIVSLALVASVFLQLAYAIHRARLMRVEMVLGPLEGNRPELASDWQIFLTLAGAALFILIAVGEWPDLVRAWRTDEFAGAEGLFKVQVWPIKLLVVAGSACAALELLRQLSLHVRRSLASPAKRARWLTPL